MFTVTLRDKTSMLFLRATVRSLHAPRIFTVSESLVLPLHPTGSTVRECSSALLYYVQGEEYLK